MKTKTGFIALTFLTMISIGCDWRGIRGNGTSKAEQREMTSFNRVEVGGFYDIQWQPGNPSLRVTTDENLLSNIETSVTDNVLKIETHGQIAPTHGVTIVITSPSLRGASLSGAVKMEASHLTGDRFTLETNGASKITLAGGVARLVANMSGASSLNAATLQAQDADISVTGAGRADITATNSLKAAITGAGKVSYGGNPKSVEKSVTGAGRISPRG